MKLILAMLALVTASAVPAQDAPTIETLRARAQERMRQDRSIYSDDEMRALEALYQSANRDLRAPGAKGILEQVVKDYPKSNRAGSAVLYLAQLSSGDEREAYLKMAIKDHGDTWYGNGVQVGAFARAQLAAFYAATDKVADAKKLAREVEERFPGAVDHNGQPLVVRLRGLKLL
jgi:exonuclease V gamma subunit